MSAPPAVTAHILRNFSIAFIGIVGTVAAGTEVYNIASRKHRELTKGWGERRQYNTQPQPQQDRLDTIFDRTQLLNKAKEAKPWNRTASEYERAKW
ncbi:hypothetical protein NA56DRAFT_706758 [Hyaloscypha hepaticicola]|uniref:Uncharacterized protein n=1 Tax=Hyaloscypha hepaticicola TaxID=2082293 RepID=A0A2J6PWV9_9HELO|nr:hypothetical protein NA56DRAFT_706758 [Hyaloscypha hepaticicola]